MLNVPFKKITDNEKFVLPTKGSKGAACWDLSYWGREPIEIGPWQRALIPLGFAVAVPEGYELQIRPRSGLAHKNGLTILNTPGCVDSDYRGEVKASVINLSDVPYTVEPMTRICQGSFNAVPDMQSILVDQLDDTERGTGGHGSTGTKQGQ